MTPKEIKKRMKNLKITQTAMAKTLGVAPATISTIVNGRSSSHRIEAAIAAALKQPFLKVWGHHPKAIQTELNNVHAAAKMVGLNIEA